MEATKSFDATALEIYPSPPLSSSLNSRGSASSSAELTYLRQTHVLNWVRLALSIICAGTGAAVVGCEAHASHRYHATHLNDQWWLPLWPQYFDMRPTTGLMVGGVLIAATSLVYLLVSPVPSVCLLSHLVVNDSHSPSPSQPHSRILTSNVIFTSSAFIGIVAAIFAVVYDAQITRNIGHNRDTLQSWTCKWSEGTAQQGLAFSPVDFKRLCVESEVSFVLAAVLVGLEAVSLMVAGVGWWVERKILRLRTGNKSNRKWQTEG